MSISYGGDNITFPDGSTQNTSPQTGFVNRIINGDMRIDQRNAGASVTAYTAFTVDRFQKVTTGNAQSSFQQVSDAPNGFTNSLKFTVTTIDATSAVYVRHPIEGYNFADMAFGSASAATVTISFWVKSSITGTYSVVLVNSAGNRSYAANYSINSANTWEQKTVTIAGDTTGTWIGATNGVGLDLRFSLASGGTTQAAGSWGTANATASTTQTNWANNSGATFYITGVSLVKGSTALPWEFRSYGQELALCQRYFETSVDGSALQTATSIHGTAFGSDTMSVYFKVTKRTQPTITLYAQNASNLSSSVNYIGYDSIGTTAGVNLTVGGTSRTINSFTASVSNASLNGKSYFNYAASSEL